MIVSILQDFQSLGAKNNYYKEKKPDNLFFVNFIYIFSLSLPSFWDSIGQLLGYTRSKFGNHK